MGIRFKCPNGHKIHVKAFLAGKRGICPECDIRFIIPAASGEEALSVANEAVAPQLAPEQAVATAVSPAKPQVQTEESAPVATVEQWYVRDAAGNQFGPATHENMQDWVAEGRVTEDCLVWCTGWPDWKHASAILLEFLPPAPSGISELEPVQPIARPATQHKVKIKKKHSKVKKMRRERARTLTLALGGLAILLLITVVLVISRGP